MTSFPSSNPVFSSFCYFLLFLCCFLSATCFLHSFHTFIQPVHHLMIPLFTTISTTTTTSAITSSHTCRKYPHRSPGHTTEILHRHPGNNIQIPRLPRSHIRFRSIPPVSESGTQYNQINAQYHSCNSGRCTFRKICHHTFLPCLWKCNYRQSTQCSR